MQRLVCASCFMSQQVEKSPQGAMVSYFPLRRDHCHAAVPGLGVLNVIVRVWVSGVVPRMFQKMTNPQFSKASRYSSATSTYRNSSFLEGYVG